MRCPRGRRPWSRPSPASAGWRPRVQEAVGAIEQLLPVSGGMLEATAAQIDARPGAAPLDSALVKVLATESAIEAVERQLRPTGKHGLSRANPLERHHRNVLCGRVHSPQQDSVRLQAGQAALDRARLETARPEAKGSAA